jgi:hypothetical protein
MTRRRTLLAITALGIGLGLAACLWLMRYLASLPFEIPPTDPLTIAAVSLVTGPGGPAGIVSAR